MPLKASAPAPAPETAAIVSDLRSKAALEPPAAAEAAGRKEEAANFGGGLISRLMERNKQ